MIETETVHHQPHVKPMDIEEEISFAVAKRVRPGLVRTHVVVFDA